MKRILITLITVTLLISAVSLFAENEVKVTIDMKGDYYIFLTESPSEIEGAEAIESSEPLTHTMYSTNNNFSLIFSKYRPNDTVVEIDVQIGDEHIGILWGEGIAIYKEIVVSDSIFAGEKVSLTVQNPYGCNVLVAGSLADFEDAEFVRVIDDLNFDFDSEDGNFVILADKPNTNDKVEFYITVGDELIAVVWKASSIQIYRLSTESEKERKEWKRLVNYIVNY